MIDIQEIIAKVISGDSQARNEFRKFCISIIRKYVFRGLSKDDVTSEVIIKLFNENCKALRNFRNEHENSIYKYLKVITENYCNDQIKKKVISDKIERLNYKEDFYNICHIPESEQPEQIFEENEKKRIIMEAALSLTHILGVVIICSLQGLKIREIACMLQLNRKTVESRYNRAKQQLEILLKNAF